MTATQAPPPGWYLDPDDAGRERWWDGADWAESRSAAHRSPALASTLRLMRIGANRVLWPIVPAILLSIAGLGLVFAVGFGIQPPERGLPVLIVLVSAILALGLVAMVVGIIGVIRARRMGGAGLAALGISVGTTIALGTGLTLAVLVAAAVA